VNYKKGKKRERERKSAGSRKKGGLKGGGTGDRGEGGVGGKSGRRTVEWGMGCRLGEHEGGSRGGVE